MIPQNSLHNQSKEKKNPQEQVFEIECNINIKPQLLTHFEKFCEILALSQNDFIDDILKMHLEAIPSGISVKDYYPIVRYYNFSDLLENKNKSADKQSDDISNHKITIKISKEINYAILRACKILRKVEPQKFIEDAIEYQFFALIDDVKREEYEFLEKLNSFSGRMNQLKKLISDLKRINSRI